MLSLAPALLAAAALLGLPQDAPAAPPAEEPLLSDIRQLTTGEQFSAAGEAYFSPDRKWVIFQATPPGEEHYQMYIARLGEAGPLKDPIRISQMPSRNTCGYFSPDGRTIIFSSTAGKEDAAEPKAGYQREGRDYKWSFPEGMEIWLWPHWEHGFVDGRPERQAHGDIRDVAPELARRALTDNQAYDAEASFSPDGRHIVFASDQSGDMEI